MSAWATGAWASGAWATGAWATTSTPTPTFTADIVSAVRAYLLSQAAITDIIGQRLYLDVLRQGATLPAATISKTSETHDHTISNRSGLVKTRLQISCHASLRLTANALAEAIYKSGIASLKGASNNANIRGVTVDDGQRNYVVYAEDGSDDHQYVTEFDLMVSYRET